MFDENWQRRRPYETIGEKELTVRGSFKCSWAKLSFGWCLRPSPDSQSHQGQGRQNTGRTLLDSDVVLFSLIPVVPPGFAGIPLRGKTPNVIRLMRLCIVVPPIFAGHLGTMCCAFKAEPSAAAPTTLWSI